MIVRDELGTCRGNTHRDLCDDTQWHALHIVEQFSLSGSDKTLVRPQCCCKVFTECRSRRAGVS